MGRQRKSRPPKIAPAKKPWNRRYERDPWNNLNVQLELHYCPSLQARWGKPPVVLEPFDLIYPKLHAREDS